MRAGSSGRERSGIRFVEHEQQQDDERNWMPHRACDSMSPSLS
jgi:hypothetical protein